jgi:hypothetical protein
MDARDAVEAAQAESEATRDEPIAEGMKGQRRGPSVVQSVRLPAAEFAQIERIAAESGVPVGALIRGWVLAGLAAESTTSLRGAIEHLAAQAERLRRLAEMSDVALPRTMPSRYGAFTIGRPTSGELGGVLARLPSRAGASALTAVTHASRVKA